MSKHWTKVPAAATWGLQETAEPPHTLTLRAFARVAGVVWEKGKDSRVLERATSKMNEFGTPTGPEVLETHKELMDKEKQKGLRVNMGWGRPSVTMSKWEDQLNKVKHSPAFHHTFFFQTKTIF